MKRLQVRAALSTLSDLATRHARWVAALAVLLVVLVWGLALYSIAIQVGGPFPGFFYNQSWVVSSFTPQHFSGLQAGLRPGDHIVAVNGQSWREMSRLVQEAGSGGSLVYTVERGDQQLTIAVPVMEFTFDIVQHFLPGYLLCSLVFVIVGVFVFTQNPAGRLNRYLLAYLLLWATNLAFAWQQVLSQQKWPVLAFYVFVLCTPVAGWVFFWSFPADRARREFLARWPVIQSFVVLAVGTFAFFTGLRALTVVLDRPALWRLLISLEGWPYFAVFGIGSHLMKPGPLLEIILRRGTARPLRQQAIVLLGGLCVSLAVLDLFQWIPDTFHVPPIADAPWAGVIVAVYPLAIGYAALRYQLFDIHVVIRKGLVYSLLTATLTATFLLLALLTGYLFQEITGRQSFLVMVIPALFVAFVFQPARQRIQTFVDRAFFRREYEARQSLTAFSRGLSTLREREEVVQLVRNTVVQTLGARDAALWLLSGERYVPAPGGPAGSLSAAGPLASWLAGERRPLVLLPDDTSAAAEELRQAGAVLAVPLRVGEPLLGLLTLAEKRSGDRYGQEDLELLATLAHSAALALENARLHEERMALLHQQLAQVTVAQEEERQRIARELHDGLAPALASLNIRLHTARKRLEQDHDPLAAELAELAEQAQANIQDIRRLIYDLRPAMLDRLGLLPALEEYVARYRAEHDTEVTLSADEGAPRLPAPVEVALFRIVQEALANVARHARARRIDIRLEQVGGEVALRVADDGQGFDPDAPRPGTHLGLWSMRERIEQLGGRLQVESAPGQGTRLTVTLPVGNPEASAEARPAYGPLH